MRRIVMFLAVTAAVGCSLPDRAAAQAKTPTMEQAKQIAIGGHS